MGEWYEPYPRLLFLFPHVRLALWICRRAYTTRLTHTHTHIYTHDVRDDTIHTRIVNG